MSDKQKSAILLLNRWYSEGVMGEEDYFLFLELILKDRETVTYPVYPWTTSPEPIVPYYKYNTITCDKRNESVTLNNTLKDE